MIETNVYLPNIAIIYDSNGDTSSYPRSRSGLTPLDTPKGEKGALTVISIARVLGKRRCNPSGLAFLLSEVRKSRGTPPCTPVPKGFYPSGHPKTVSGLIFRQAPGHLKESQKSGVRI
jgi:hypothetical protein